MRSIRSIFFCLLLLCSEVVIGSDPPTINERFDNASLKEVLQLLRKKYKVKLAYSEKLISGKTVTVELNGLSLDEAFDKILADQAITYEYIHPNAVILKPEKKGPQEITITGEVFDVNTRERLPFASVFDKQSGRFTTTNVDGYFSLTLLSNNPELQVSYVGYNDTILQKVDFEKRRAMIALSPSLNTLGEVVISSNSDNFSSPDAIGEIDLNPTLVKRMPQNAEKDIFRMLQMLPGISSTNELSSGLTINGGTSNQNLILFDGFSVYHQDHLFGYFSAINPYAIKSVRTLKTGYPASYGGRSSGVVQFTGNDGSASGFGGRVGINLLSANISLEAPITPNTTAFFATRRSYTSVYPTFLFDRIFDLYSSSLNDVNAIVKSQEYHPDFSYDDLNFKLSTKLSPRDQVNLSFYQSNDRLDFEEELEVEYPGDTTSMDENNGNINWGNIGASFRMMRLWNDTDYSEIIVSYSNYESSFRESSQQTSFVDDQLFETQAFESRQSNSIEDLGIKLSHDISTTSIDWQLGIEASYFNTRINNLLNNELLTEKEQDGLLLGTGYVQSEIHISPISTLGVGARATYAEGRQNIYLEPRVHFNQELSDNFRLRAAAGLYNQFINQINTRNVLDGSRDLWVLSDNQVPVQIATHYSIAGTYTKNGVGIDATIFHRRFRGILDYAFRRGNEITEFTNYEDLFFEGEGRSTGLELLLKRESKFFTGWIGYTLSSVENRFDELNNGDWYSADHDQRHEINLYLSRKFGRYTLYSTWVFGSGRPFSEFAGGRRPNEDNDELENVIVVSAAERNNQRLPEYHRLDMGVSSTWNLGKVILEANLHIFNVYDRSNVHSLELMPLPGPGNGPGPGGDDMPPPPPPPDGGPPPPPPQGGPPPRRPQQSGFTSIENNLMGFTPSFSLDIKF